MLGGHWAKPTAKEKCSIKRKKFLLDTVLGTGSRSQLRRPGFVAAPGPWGVVPVPEEFLFRLGALRNPLEESIPTKLVAVANPDEANTLLQVFSLPLSDWWGP